jgi:hypothetical protein
VGAIENPLLWISVFGAFFLNVSVRTQGRRPISLLHVLNVDVAKDTGHPMAILADLVLSSILSGSAVFAMTQPTNVPQAIVAGLGATGLLDAAKIERRR